MSTFKVGEVCIMQNSHYPPNNGRECVVVRALGLHRVDGELLACYITQTSDGEIWGSEPHQLRRKRPPTTGEESIIAMFHKDKQPQGEPA